MTANSNFQTNKSLGQGHNINFIFKMTDCKLLFQVNICAKNAGGFWYQSPVGDEPLPGTQSHWPDVPNLPNTNQDSAGD